MCRVSPQPPTSIGSHTSFLGNVLVCFGSFLIRSHCQSSRHTPPILGRPSSNTYFCCLLDSHLASSCPRPQQQGTPLSDCPEQPLHFAANPLLGHACRRAQTRDANDARQQLKLPPASWPPHTDRTPSRQRSAGSVSSQARIPLPGLEPDRPSNIPASTASTIPPRLAPAHEQPALCFPRPASGTSAIYTLQQRYIAWPDPGH